MSYSWYFSVNGGALVESDRHRCILSKNQVLVPPCPLALTIARVYLNSNPLILGGTVVW